MLTLDGKEQIGYVPRAETERALPEDADAAFAFVRSVGRAHPKEGGEGEREDGEEGGREEGEEAEGREGHGGHGGDGGDGGDGGEGEEGDRERLGPWGVSVALKPGLPPLEIDALPSAISSAGPLSGALPESEWRRLAKEAAVASGFRCSVTGGVGGGGGVGAGESGDRGESRSAPVEAHEHWRVDDEGRVATLLAVRALCPEAHDVAVSQFVLLFSFDFFFSFHPLSMLLFSLFFPPEKKKNHSTFQQHALSLQSPEAKARALLTLRTVNGWSSEDASLYWRGREELVASRSGSEGKAGSEGESGCGKEEQQKPEARKRKKETSSPPSWRIDARWLASRGVDLGQLSPAWRELLV